MIEGNQKQEVSQKEQKCIEHSTMKKNVHDKIKEVLNDNQSNHEI